MHSKQDIFDEIDSSEVWYKDTNEIPMKITLLNGMVKEWSSLRPKKEKPKRVLSIKEQEEKLLKSLKTIKDKLKKLKNQSKDWTLFIMPKGDELHII